MKTVPRVSCNSIVTDHVLLLQDELTNLQRGGGGAAAALNLTDVWCFLVATGAYDCHFCPDERKEKGAPRDMSRSYLSSEGTFIRGAIEDFKPAGQACRVEGRGGNALGIMDREG